jgi:tripartite-type tricarboxylate transporter receptor subunit TctC
VRFAAALCALGIAALPAYAQEYPYQSIRIIDGFAPGGATDFLARSIGPS